MIVFTRRLGHRKVVIAVDSDGVMVTTWRDRREFVHIEILIIIAHKGVNSAQEIEFLLDRHVDPR